MAKLGTKKAKMKGLAEALKGQYMCDDSGQNVNLASMRAMGKEMRDLKELVLLMYETMRHYATHEM